MCLFEMHPINFSVLFLLVICPILIFAEVNFNEQLFLTPYIKAGQITEARKLSQVHNFSETVTSYSGLITADEKNGAHTFFWFFPAAENYDNAPVLLWSDGGPGVTGLNSVFNMHGPFSFDSAGNLSLRETTWTKNHSIIYMDQPMDVGYSFIENENGHVSSGFDTAPNLYNFLVQFFKLFPELQKNDFYNSGVSYGGIYAPAAAHYIHIKNNENPELKINLKGLLLETPFCDPMSQVDYGEYLYHIGLIDDHAREYFRSQSKVIRSLISEEKYLEAQELNLELLWGSVYGTYFNNVTGYPVYFNILHDHPDQSQANIAVLVESENFRNALHVGNLTFTLVSPLVQNSFKPTILKSIKPMLEDILNWGYDVLIYSGNMDIITSHIGISTMVKNLNWTGTEEYSNVRSQIWRVDDTVAGYAKNVGNFTYVTMKNAGHAATGDQHAWSFDLLNRFTQRIPFGQCLT